MATRFFGMINKEIKNISGYLSNGNKKQQSRSLDDQHNEILSSNVYNHNNLNDDNDFNLNKQRYPKCSTSSSIDSGNSTSSSESNNQLNTKQQNNLVIGQSTFHNTSLSSSQLSSGYSTLKSKTELDQQEEQQQINENNKDIDLGNTERIYAEPTDFEYLKVIGQGSYGKVFLARHKKEQKVYAVKVLQKKIIITKNEQHHIMCERNVLLKNLNHPFLVGLHYSFQTRDKLYFVLEFVSGGELFFHLQQENCFTEPRARFYAAEITSALGYLHKRNIVYRDLKPENILLDKDGHIVLTDFGLCKDNLKFDETTTTLCGSLDYLSPEIVKKERYGWSVDWWCLGSVLYEMLYGLPPFYSRDHKEMFYNILNKPVKVRTNISISARDIITGLLNKNKDLRLGSKNDVDEIKSHDFFREINWSDLESKKIEPPFNPNVKNNMDLRNISTEFTNEPVSNSLYRSSIGPSSIPEHAFKGFSYAPNVYN